MPGLSSGIESLTSALSSLRRMPNTSLRAKKRQHSQRNGCELPTDMLLLILEKADVQTKIACAQAAALLRNLLLTASAWTDNVRLDLHDSRQLLWLERHFQVMQSLSICMESWLVGRLNRVIRRVRAPCLQQLAIYILPDDPEHSRMLPLELRTLPLLRLHISNRGWSPLLSTHQLPASLRSLSFEPCQDPDAQVYFGGRHARPCLSRSFNAQRWRFAEHLPVALTSLRVSSSCAWDLVWALKSLTRLTNLKQLDVDVGKDHLSAGRSEALMRAIQAMPYLQRVVMHMASDSHHFTLSDAGRLEVRRTLNLMCNEPPWASCTEDMIWEASCPRLSSLVVHFRGITTCPGLWRCSILRELVLAHCPNEFAFVFPETFTVAGLEAVAATLTRLVVSTDRALTSVYLPRGLHLQSLMLVCTGTLAVHGDVSRMCTGLKEAVFGYAELLGDSAGLVSGLSSRLSDVELEVLGSQPLRQALRFTHAALVGEWWHRVHHKSRSSNCQGSLQFCVRVWREGHLCPAHAAFAQYGIVAMDDDWDVRDVRLNHDEGEFWTRPGWYSPVHLRRDLY